jgi:hypothetical protein
MRNAKFNTIGYNNSVQKSSINKKNQFQSPFINGRAIFLSIHIEYMRKYKPVFNNDSFEGKAMDFYFNAPKWDEDITRKDIPHTCLTAQAIEFENVRDQTVIHITNGMYRNAEINGIFLISKSVKLPLGDFGKRRVFLYCKWFGHRLLGDKGISVLVELPVTIEKNYSGKVVSNIAKRTVETKKI